MVGESDGVLVRWWPLSLQKEKEFNGMIEGLRVRGRVSVLLWMKYSGKEVRSRLRVNRANKRLIILLRGSFRVQGTSSTLLKYTLRLGSGMLQALSKMILG